MLVALEALSSLARSADVAADAELLQLFPALSRLLLDGTLAGACGRAEAAMPAERDRQACEAAALLLVTAAVDSAAPVWQPPLRACIIGSDAVRAVMCWLDRSLASASLNTLQYTAMSVPCLLLLVGLAAFGPGACEMPAFRKALAGAAAADASGADAAEARFAEQRDAVRAILHGLCELSRHAALDEEALVGLAAQRLAHKRDGSAPSGINGGSSQAPLSAGLLKEACAHVHAVRRRGKVPDVQALRSTCLHAVGVTLSTFLDRCAPLYTLVVPERIDGVDVPLRGSSEDGSAHERSNDGADGSVTGAAGSECSCQQEAKAFEAAVAAQAQQWHADAMFACLGALGPRQHLRTGAFTAAMAVLQTLEAGSGLLAVAVPYSVHERARALAQAGSAGGAPPAAATAPHMPVQLVALMMKAIPEATAHVQAVYSAEQWRARAGKANHEGAAPANEPQRRAKPPAFSAYDVCDRTAFHSCAQLFGTLVGVLEADCTSAACVPDEEACPCLACQGKRTVCRWFEDKDVSRVRSCGPSVVPCFSSAGGRISAHAG